MKRFLLWVVGVILGVAVLLGAVMTVSYSFTGEGSRPAADTQQLCLVIPVGREEKVLVLRG